ncbi:colicin import membrane protein [Streptomyces sp. PvR006]|uniref:peptidase n=1 Tax=Streptomyces sp. PvR006 TaxID=2817860 RepID=UPI001AE7F362|nr:peptidase [Streptomyces sp. PvR006]MBP2584010.1 colicin import membrane protein [Streptomyces sp. PvR006]
MKIRRILATAVAAAVTTPVVFLSAAPAFADTKPAPASTQKPAADDDDPDEDMPSLEELRAAVALAQKEYDEAVAVLDKAVTDLKAFDKPDHPLQLAVTDAKTAAEAAATAKTAADEELTKAQKALAELPADATEEQKTAAADAVTAAQTAAATAATAKTAADEKLGKASKDLAEAQEAASTVVGLARKVKKSAEEKLTEAKDELEFFEDIGGECEEDDSIKVALSGPKTITAGQSASFSLRVSNTSDRTLENVEAYVDAVRFPEPGELIDDETDFSKRIIPVEWSSADNLEWTPFTEEFDSIEVGKLVKGGHYDVKLRLTVPADAAAGKGAAFSVAEYDNNDGDCGIGEQFAQTEFDILAAKTDKPKPTPEPTPSETTATPTPAPTSGGNGNTSQQGGSSNTAVKGTLAATGANENLTQLGLAAAATVALGAGAVVIARRRRAGADA